MFDWLTKYVSAELGFVVIITLLSMGLFLAMLGMLGIAQSKSNMKTELSEQVNTEMQEYMHLSRMIARVGLMLFVAGIIAYLILPK